jgi:DNA-directed RNA polymerase subunit RPC12/RpoP
MTTAAQTAEWICTRCGATNRKLVPVRTSRTNDRCVTCHAKHIVELDSRPVRWNARLEKA